MFLFSKCNNKDSSISGDQIFILSLSLIFILFIC